MVWREVCAMDERREFVRLALQEGANVRALCRRFGVSPATGYKWIERWRANAIWRTGRGGHGGRRTGPRQRSNRPF